MIVATHGMVDEYCAAHDMVIAERYSGDIEKYRGTPVVLVTDSDLGKNEFYRLKMKLLARRVELISTNWSDPEIDEFVSYLAMRPSKSGGRVKFGYKRINGELVEDAASMAVVRKIISMRDAGATYRKIAEDVRYPDGRRMSISTVQIILSNRGGYENAAD